MKKRSRFLIAVSLAVVFAMLISSTAFAKAYDGEDSVVIERTPKEGFNETVELVTEVIDAEKAESLYLELASEVSLARSGEQTIFDLLGADVSTQRALASVDNVRSNENYVRFSLDNGGSIGYDEALGIVNVKNFKRSNDISHEKSLSAVVETISRDLSLIDYTVTECGLYQEQQNYYRIVWEKTVNGDAQSNPFDSVWVLLDSETYQLLYLERYNLDVNATEAQITKDEALSIASPYFSEQSGLSSEADGEIEIRLTYVRPDSVVSIEKQTQASSVNLAYIVKNSFIKVTIDAITGEVISVVEAANATNPGRCFGCADSVVSYSSQKMDLANKGMTYLGYDMLSNYTCTSSSANTVVNNFWDSTSNYGFYISAHGSATSLTNNKTGTAQFRVTSSEVGSKNWNFVYLDACSTATGTSWSSAFGITNSSKNEAFIGFDGSAYMDDTYNFAIYFWSEVGRSSISDCVAYGDTAPGMDDTTPVFRGDTTYYGWI